MSNVFTPQSPSAPPLGGAAPPDQALITQLANIAQILSKLVVATNNLTAAIQALPSNTFNVKDVT